MGKKLNILVFILSFFIISSLCLASSEYKFISTKLTIYGKKINFIFSNGENSIILKDNGNLVVGNIKKIKYYNKGSINLGKISQIGIEKIKYYGKASKFSGKISEIGNYKIKYNDLNSKNPLTISKLGNIKFLYYLKPSKNIRKISYISNIKILYEKQMESYKNQNLIVIVDGQYEEILLKPIINKTNGIIKANAGIKKEVKIEKQISDLKKIILTNEGAKVEFEFSVKGNKLLLSTSGNLMSGSPEYIKYYNNISENSGKIEKIGKTSIYYNNKFANNPGKINKIGKIILEYNNKFSQYSGRISKIGKTAIKYYSNFSNNAGKIEKIGTTNILYNGKFTNNPGTIKKISSYNIQYEKIENEINIESIGALKLIRENYSTHWSNNNLKIELKDDDYLKVGLKNIKNSFLTNNKPTLKYLYITTTGRLLKIEVY